MFLYLVSAYLLCIPNMVSLFPQYVGSMDIEETGIDLQIDSSLHHAFLTTGTLPHDIHTAAKRGCKPART